ncbi:hypothetical protein C922_00469 [Plasmodium inui San Antonio 1]|uniref:HORMA domain-containing protein n=1 Tax=Plasmodium inui San Antonio 1 TaxID=1237626 RepID=W7ATK6_9APIC|nr:hypothetical protein C922_00469 [Plasmodium inui San Antonio 1]EUD68781.1 hypothetical protein C922_00469 [Plasmodium inui San Antonio 1]
MISRMSVRTHTQSETLTKQDSVNMLKNIIKLGISLVTYLRNLFEESAYEEVHIQELKLKRLLPINREAHMIINWLEKGVFDAIEKEYLRILILDINDIYDNSIECYKFSFSYNSIRGGKIGITLETSKNNPNKVCTDSQMEEKRKNFNLNRLKDIKDRLLNRKKTNKETALCFKKDAKQNTYELLRSLVLLTQTLNPLPERTYLSMKLLYYDEIVPYNYQPPYFRNPDSKDLLKFVNLPNEDYVGKVDTGHHYLSIVVNSTTASNEQQVSSYNGSEMDNRDMTNSNRRPYGKIADGDYYQYNREGEHPTRAKNQDNFDGGHHGDSHHHQDHDLNKHAAGRSENRYKQAKYEEDRRAFLKKRLVKSRNKGNDKKHCIVIDDDDFAEEEEDEEDDDAHDDEDDDSAPADEEDVEWHNGTIRGGADNRTGHTRNRLENRYEDERDAYYDYSDEYDDDTEEDYDDTEEDDSQVNYEYHEEYSSLSDERSNKRSKRSCKKIGTKKKRKLSPYSSDSRMNEQISASLVRVIKCSNDQDYSSSSDNNECYSKIGQMLSETNKDADEHDCVKVEKREIEDGKRKKNKYGVNNKSEPRNCYYSSNPYRRNIDKMTTRLYDNSCANNAPYSNTNGKATNELNKPYGIQNNSKPNTSRLYSSYRVDDAKAHLDKDRDRNRERERSQNRESYIKTHKDNFLMKKRREKKEKLTHKNLKNNKSMEKTFMVKYKKKKILHKIRLHIIRYKILSNTKIKQRFPSVSNYDIDRVFNKLVKENIIHKNGCKFYKFVEDKSDGKERLEKKHDGEAGLAQMDQKEQMEQTRHSNQKLNEEIRKEDDSIVHPVDHPVVDSVVDPVVDSIVDPAVDLVDHPADDPPDDRPAEQQPNTDANFIGMSKEDSVKNSETENSYETSLLNNISDPPESQEGMEQIDKEDENNINQINDDIQKLYNDVYDLCVKTKYVNREIVTKGLNIYPLLAKPLIDRLLREAVLKKKIVKNKGYESNIFVPIESAYIANNRVNEAGVKSDAPAENFALAKNLADEEKN